MPQDLPFFSIIIPTYDRPQLLATCLDSLLGLDYPQDSFEVIVVDDGGAVSLAGPVACYAGKIPLTLVEQAHAGPAAARNTGVTHAKGRFLLFLDDDCMPALDWLRVLAAEFAQTPDSAIGGRTVNALPMNPYAQASWLIIDYLYTYFNPDACQASFFASNNLAVPADRFRAIGGFDTSFLRAAAEDRDLCDRWRQHGFGMRYAPKAVIYHAHGLDGRTFWWQHFHYGQGAFRFHQTRAQRGQEPIRVEPLRFYLGLLRSPFSHTHGRHALALAGLVIVSQVANAGGFWWEWLVHYRLRHVKTQS